MSNSSSVELSPFHRIQLAAEYVPLLEKAPRRDFSLRTIYVKTAADGQKPLKQAELVIAGEETRAAFPLAARYPVHFLKTYFPSSLYTDPQREYDCTLAAAELLGTPAPIGCTRNTFRTSFIPGKPLDKLSPFGVEPEERNLDVARKLPEISLLGLWRLLEEAYGQVARLHGAGMTHNDVHTHNFIVCLAPARVFLIDYELAERDEATPEEKLGQRRTRDVEGLLREAVYVQCVLGRQDGALAEAAEAALPKLFRRPDYFRQRLQEASALR